MATPLMNGARKRLALLVRSRPYRHRAARADLDLALAAAALDFDLEVYFLGGACCNWRPGMTARRRCCRPGTGPGPLCPG
jgi:hypothetical protein